MLLSFIDNMIVITKNCQQPSENLKRLNRFCEELSYYVNMNYPPRGYYDSGRCPECIFWKKKKLMDGILNGLAILPFILANLVLCLLIIRGH